MDLHFSGMPFLRVLVVRLYSFKFTIALNDDTFTRRSYSAFVLVEMTPALLLQTKGFGQDATSIIVGDVDFYQGMTGMMGNPVTNVLRVIVEYSCEMFCDVSIHKRAGCDVDNFDFVAK